ncbi:MAG: hypothetical protein WCJ87_11155 [Burkholderiales bacterium]
MIAGRRMIIVALAAVSALLLVAGCSTATPLATAPAVALPKSFHVGASEAGLYIIRSERVGGAIPLDVLIDGQRLGATVARSYLYAVVTPGIHTVESLGDIRHTLEVDLKPGTISYLSQVVELSYLTAPRTRLRQVNDAQGREWVMELKAAPLR